MKLIRTIRILTLASFLAASLPVFAIDSANDPEYLYSKAMMLKTQKDYAQAIEILNKLIPEGKQLDHIYYQIASCYMSQTDYQQAIAYARKSIDANGKYLEPYQLIFDIYMTLKNYDEAIEILNQLLDEDPSQIQSWYTLGVVYSQNAQNNQLAAYCFRKVLEIAQKTAVPAFYKEQSSLILAEIYYGNKEYRTAISYLDDAVKINPHNSIRYYRFASNLLSLDMLDSARICIENFLENLPESQKRAPFIKDFYAFLGNLYYISENPQANYYLRLGSGTENIDRYAAQQIFQLTAAHDNQAEQTLEKITAEYPRYASPYVALGRIHRDRGEIDAAYDSFMRAGSILIKTDMESATVSCFLEAHKLKPNEP
ncbi:MAG TPA: tetratricopeptide repeat protein, partial [Spirochaetota bacterium]